MAGNNSSENHPPFLRIEDDPNVEYFDDRKDMKEHKPDAHQPKSGRHTFPFKDSPSERGRLLINAKFLVQSRALGAARVARDSMMIVFVVEFVTLCLVGVT